jgi:hypothetical protein
VYAINVQPVVFGEPSCITTTDVSKDIELSGKISNLLAISSPLPHNFDDNCYYLTAKSRTVKGTSLAQEDQEFTSKISINGLSIVKVIFSNRNGFFSLIEEFDYLKS